MRTEVAVARMRAQEADPCLLQTLRSLEAPDVLRPERRIFPSHELSQFFTFQYYPVRGCGDPAFRSCLEQACFEAIVPLAMGMRNNRNGSKAARRTRLQKSREDRVKELAARPKHPDRTASWFRNGTIACRERCRSWRPAPWLPIPTAAPFVKCAELFMGWNCRRAPSSPANCYGTVTTILPTCSLASM